MKKSATKKDKIYKEVIRTEKNRIGGLDDYSLQVCGYNKEKILNAVKGCVSAMGELTISESKIARKHLDSVMEEMYRRSPDTVINTIQPPL